MIQTQNLSLWYHIYIKVHALIISIQKLKLLGEGRQFHLYTSTVRGPEAEPDVVLKLAFIPLNDQRCLHAYAMLDWLVLGFDFSSERTGFLVNLLFSIEYKTYFLVRFSRFLCISVANFKIQKTTFLVKKKNFGTIKKKWTMVMVGALRQKRRAGSQYP